MKQKKVYLESTDFFGGLLVQVKNDTTDLMCYNTSIAMQFDKVADAKKFVKQNNRVGKYKAINEKTAFIQCFTKELQIPKHSIIDINQNLPF